MSRTIYEPSDYMKKVAAFNTEVAKQIKRFKKLMQEYYEQV